MGLPRSAISTGPFRSSLSAGGFIAHGKVLQRPYTHHIAFWLKPISIFGLFLLTTFIESSHLLTMRSTLAPPPP